MAAAGAALGGELMPMAAAGSLRRHGLLRWIGRRVALSVVVLFLVTVVVFAATQALPSSPAEAILGREATPARVAALNKELGLDRPIVDQYTSWLGGVVHGDFGTSLSTRKPVADTIRHRLVNSLLLLAICALIAIPVAIGLGALAAVRRDRLGDKAGLGAALILGSVPEFVIGIFFTILLATTVWKVLPAVATFPESSLPLAHPEEILLPILTLVVAMVPYLYRLVRASMIEILESDYVQMARLKGVPPALIVRRHALPNALVPTIQASALVLASLLSGVVVIEYLFRYPGLGTSLAEGIANRDLPLIQGVTLVYAAAIVLLNLVADLLTVLVSPKLREELR